MDTHQGKFTIEPPTVAGYSILEELGRGGMGVVYKALQMRLNRLVALKLVLDKKEIPPDDLVRFLVEGELLARLRHANIVQIYEVGKFSLDNGEGRPYMAMEFVDGGTLKQQMHGRPHSARSAAQMIITLSRAVHYAHEQGIVHRDLKPANVLMTAEGIPKITDFGLAKQTRMMSDLTEAGFVVGTPEYMAPEQTRGKQVGPASDVHALGMLLYELLTGKSPFMADTEEEIMHLVARTAPLPPSRIVPQIPLDLETICLKCLAKHPSQRYATAAGLADDLERFLAGQDVEARKLTRTQRVGRWVKRNRLAAALAVVCFVLLGSLVELAVLYRQARASANANQGQGRFERVRQQVNQLASDYNNNGDVLHGLAATLAAAAAAADAPETADNYAALAVEMLGLARKASYFDPPERVQKLKSDAAFESLHGREGFKELVRELEKR